MSKRCCNILSWRRDSINKLRNASPRGDLNSELRQPGWVNQLDRSSSLTSVEVSNFYIKLSDVLRDTRESVLLRWTDLWGSYAVPIPSSASEVKFQPANVLQGRKSFNDDFEDVFINATQIKGSHFGTDG